MSNFDTYLNNVIDIKTAQGNLENGLLTLKAKIPLYLTEGGCQAERILEVATDFKACGLKKDVSFFDGYNDVDGINAEFVTEDNVINSDALMQAWMRDPFGRACLTKEMVHSKMCICVEDAQEAFLYNMLVSVAKAILFQNGPKKDQKTVRGYEFHGFRVENKKYDSKHVGVYDEDGPDMGFLSYCGPPMNGERGPSVQPVIIGDSDYPSIVRFPALTGSQFRFYVDHLGGREVTDCDYPGTGVLNFEFDIPGVDHNVGYMPFCKLDTRAKYEWSNSPVDYTDPDTMYDWLKQYVLVNRLERAFAAAHEMLCTLAFQPLRPSAESTVWDETIYRVVLPKMKFGRATTGLLLEGKPVRQSTLRDTVTRVTQFDLKQDMIRGALTNYASWLGMYSTVVHTADYLGNNWKKCYDPGYYDLGLWDSYGFKAKMVSYLTGVDAVTYEHAAAFVLPDPGFLKFIGPDIRHVKKEDPHPVLNDYVYMPVSGCLLLGAIKQVGPRLKHLQSHQVHKIERGDYLRLGFEGAASFVQIYRLFGYDTLLYDACGHLIRPWAPVREHTIETASIYRDQMKAPHFTVADMVPRPNTADKRVPTLDSLLLGKTLELAIGKPIVSQANFGTRFEVTPIYKPLSARPAIRFKIKAGFTGEVISSSTYDKFPTFQQGDFRLAEDTLEPQNPVDTTGLGVSRPQPEGSYYAPPAPDVEPAPQLSRTSHIDRTSATMAIEESATNVDSSTNRGTESTKIGHTTLESSLGSPAYAPFLSSRTIELRRQQDLDTKD